MFDPSNLTLHQLDTIESHGVTLNDLVQAAAQLDPAAGTLPPAKFLIAMHYMTAVATNPDATWEESAACRIADLVAALTEDDDRPE